MNKQMKALLAAGVAGMCLLGCGKSDSMPVTTAPVQTAAAETAGQTSPATAPVTTSPTPTLPQAQSYILTFVGDCTLGANPSNFYAGVGFVKTVGDDYDYPFRNVRSYFEGDDATFVNLEGPLTNVGNPADKTHTFRGPTAYSRILTGSSVDAVTLANNHSMDYGQIGYDSTVETLENADIPFVERDKTCLVTLDGGLKIGLYGMVYYDLDQQAMEAGIAALKEQGADVIIVAPHWGVEGSYQPNQVQIDLGHAAIDAGANIVWGSHPHVLQPMEEYRDGLILYSMGNFCFGGNGAPDDLDSALIQQEVVKTPDGRISLGRRRIVPCAIGSQPGKNNYQPTPMEVDSQSYRRVLEKLEGTFRGPNLKIHKIAK